MPYQSIRYGLKQHEIAVFFHYFPSFWQLHIHFASLKVSHLGNNQVAGKAIFLDDVIEILERSGSFQETTLTVMFDNEELKKAFQVAGAIPLL